MVQCEMCGTETASPTTIKVEGAELEVCADCTGFGTEVRTDEQSSTSTKYSTSSSSSSTTSSSSSGGAQNRSSGGSSNRRQDMFDEMEEVVTDYDNRIRNARESKELSQEELASQINEKASLIRKLERGNVLPSDDVQRKLERKLDISLTEEGGETDTEWETNLAEDGLTLGDKVQRRDE